MKHYRPNVGNSTGTSLPAIASSRPHKAEAEAVCQSHHIAEVELSGNVAFYHKTNRQKEVNYI